MDVEQVNKIISRHQGLSQTLGMEFFSTPNPDTCMAKMKVDERNRQPFGFLSGGATLALAENLAGVGSSALCPGKICVGIGVNGNHVKAVSEGDIITATAHLKSKANKLHVWQVDVRNNAHELISSIQVTNYIISPQDKATGKKKEAEGSNTTDNAKEDK